MSATIAIRTADFSGFTMRSRDEKVDRCFVMNVMRNVLICNFRKGVFQVGASNPLAVRLLRRSGIRTGFLNELAMFQGREVLSSGGCRH